MIIWNKIDWSKLAIIEEKEDDTDFWATFSEKYSCWNDFLNANLPTGKSDNVHWKEYLIFIDGEVHKAKYDDQNEYPAFWCESFDWCIKPEYWAEINLPE